MIKFLKWLFLGLWLVCVIAFTVGQLLAPPEYHLIPNSRWGELFGTSVVIGILSFGLAILFFIIDFLTHKNKEETKKETDKKLIYNLSFKRIVSRMIITGILGIVFGIAMIPFLRDATGLLYEQRAAIGGGNMIKAIVLWGVFTTIVSMYAFWKKHLRMVSVLLIICWLISIFSYLVLGMFESNNYRCDRPNPYSMPSEFNRSLDLISQRMGVDSTGTNTIWQTVFNYRNCLDIQYSESDDKSVEAYFEYPNEKNQANLQNLKIRLNPSYKNFDDLTLATLLSHELVHAGQYINEVVNKTSFGCFESEANAFTAQHAFILALNEEEQRSIYTRLQDNPTKNPTIATFLLTGQRGTESAKACMELQKKNNLTEEQMNKCSWEGLENKLLLDVKEDSYYQEQCNINNK